MILTFIYRHSTLAHRLIVLTCHNNVILLLTLKLQQLAYLSSPDEKLYLVYSVKWAISSWKSSSVTYMSNISTKPASVYSSSHMPINKPNPYLAESKLEKLCYLTLSFSLQLTRTTQSVNTWKINDMNLQAVSENKLTWRRWICLSWPEDGFWRQSYSQCIDYDHVWHVGRFCLCWKDPIRQYVSK